MKRTPVAVALVSLAALLYEVTLTRLLSFSLWYHFAFLVVGVALLGTAAAASWLSVRAREADRATPARWALALAAALPLSHVAFQLIGFEPFRLAVDPLQWVLGLLGIAALAIPFFATGIVIAGLLAQAGARPFGLYAADLIGAGAGAALAPLAIRIVGAPGAVLLAGASAAAAALLFALENGRRSQAIAAGIALGALLCTAPLGDRVLPWRVTQEKRIGSLAAEDVLRNPGVTLYSAWDLGSRVDVIATPQGARILIDAGTAMTRVPTVPRDLQRLVPIEDVTATVLRGARRALVIGSGGGWEVLRALSHGVAHVDAVEINPLVVEWVQADRRYGAARLHDDPRVQLWQDEARAFLARSEHLYDAILMVHTISNAAYGAGAMSLAEDYVLTREAFGLLLEHLTPGGLLLITRPTAQLPRLCRTLESALSPAGAGLEGHAVTFTDPRTEGFFSGVVVSRKPLAAARLQEISRHLDLLGLVVSSPDRLPAQPPRSDTRPATDDRPFFSQRVRFTALRPADFRGVLGGDAPRGDPAKRGQAGRMALEERPVAEVAAVGTGLIAMVIGLLGVVLPLLVSRRTRGALAHQPLTTMVRFAAIGLAFLFVEIALMQQVTRVVGNPSLAFTVVLTALLLGSGISSRLGAPRIALRSRPLRASMLIAAATTGLVAVCAAPLLSQSEAWPLAARVALAALLCGLTGLALGTPFPVALGQAGRLGESIPWAFAVNGFASVGAPAIAVVIGAEVGLTATLLCAALLYALAGLLPAAGDRS